VTQDFDVIIVGTGAGGGTLAHTLARSAAWRQYQRGGVGARAASGAGRALNGD
jgi:flavin-dependent dehydrogenase